MLKHVLLQLGLRLAEAFLKSAIKNNIDNQGLLQTSKFYTNKIWNRKIPTLNTESDLVSPIKSQSGEKSASTESKKSSTTDTCGHSKK